MNQYLWAMAGTGFIFLMTCIGSSMVFFIGNRQNDIMQKLFLGFAAGVMISASVFGLLTPAIEEAEQAGHIGWIPAAGGFIIGVLFLYILDRIIPHLHPYINKKEGMSTSMKRTTLLVLAVTLHNIPEGMAVGLSFALAAQHGDVGSYSAAMALALGIGIQNFPEGAAVSLPMRQEGASKGKSFIYGCISGVVEPIFGMLTVFVAAGISTYMPWLLSVAAGAMMYVIIEELIPEAHLGEHSHVGTISVLVGFLVMMILDVALG